MFRIGINALYTKSRGKGGMETYLFNLLKHILELDREHQYIIFSNRKNYKSFHNLVSLVDQHSQQGNVEVVCCPVKPGLGLQKTFWEQFILPFQIKKYKINLLFSPAYISSLLSPCQTVVTIHCMNYHYNPQDYEKVQHLILKSLIYLSAKSSTKIITDSRNSKQDIINILKIPAERAKAIYLGVDEDFSPEKKLSKEELLHHFGIEGKFIMSLSGYQPHKNISKLIEAYNILRNKYRIKHHLVLVGSQRKDESSVTGLVKNLSLEDFVSYTGFVPDNPLQGLYASADLFVFPSSYEGFGLPVLEAMASGTPIVSSNKAALPEIVDDAGILIEPNNTDEMAQVIYKVLTDEKLKSYLKEKGLLRAKEFSWKRTAKETLMVFKEFMHQ